LPVAAGERMLRSPGGTTAAAPARVFAAHYKLHITKRRQIMATYISLLSFTEQGIRNIKDSPDRYGTFKAMAEKLGVTVKGFYYTLGRYDAVVIVEGSDEAVTTAFLKAGSLGNVRSESLRGFTVDEAKRLIGNLP
jgi:uncharacterized protein with GYD domain